MLIYPYPVFVFHYYFTYQLLMFSMPILSLSEGTIRQLGSAPVITSPVALLKEFLDNAIDSGASSIDISVSPNTVDKIEVRDNGHGIHPTDFTSLGRPGHTSKLKSFGELDTLGGKTLGFRGAALASACSLAHVLVITRASQEPTAASLRLAEGGGIETQRLAGAPVGTTIRATDLFFRLPVRRQVAVNDAPRNLARMRDLLQSYAFARPRTRLRFTVLKTPNLSWSYTPGSNGGVKEVAMQLLGTELSSQCMFVTSSDEAVREGGRSSSVADTSNTLHEEGSAVTFEALLPRCAGPDSKMMSKGAFLSVDSRPISPSRPTAKKLVSIFKKQLSKIYCQSQTDNHAPWDPFMRLDIQCPPGSYDVNIEPLKEDVLFRDEQHVLDRFEAFLSQVYRPSEHADLPGNLKRAEVTEDGTPGRSVMEVRSQHLSAPVRRTPYCKLFELLTVSRLKGHHGKLTCRLAWTATMTLAISRSQTDTGTAKERPLPSKKMLTVLAENGPRKKD
jgi:DNA mismatch repair protein MutL